LAGSAYGTAKTRFSVLQRGAVWMAGRRSCEIIPEKAKTSHAKAPRRRGAKKTKQLFFAIFAIFAPLRETVYFFAASEARATFPPA
jgi:hypothetical protein